MVKLERRVVVKALLFSYAFKTDVNQLLHISRDRQTNQFSSVQSLSCVQLFVPLLTVARQASLFVPTPGAYETHVH